MSCWLAVSVVGWWVIVTDGSPEWPGIRGKPFTLHTPLSGMALLKEGNKAWIIQDQELILSKELVFGRVFKRLPGD